MNERNVLKIYNVELCSKCNLGLTNTCKACPMSYTPLQRTRAVMSQNDALKIKRYMDKYSKELGWRQEGIWLNNMGECFLLPKKDLLWFIDLFEEYQPCFATNGMFLDKFYPQVPLQFKKLKFLQVDCEEYKVPNWKKYLDSVLRYWDAGVKIVFVGMSDMSKEREDLVWGVSKKYGIPFLKTPIHNWHGSLGQWKDMVGDQSLWDKYEEECPVARYGWVTVLSDGVVVACCLTWKPHQSLVLGTIDDLELGKIKHQWPYEACHIGELEYECHKVFASRTSPVGTMVIQERGEGKRKGLKD